MAKALLAFWRQLRAGEQLERWTTESGTLVHTTFWEQMQPWAETIALAFSNESLSLRDWLPIIESAKIAGHLPAPATTPVNSDLRASGLRQ